MNMSKLDQAVDEANRELKRAGCNPRFDWSAGHGGVELWIHNYTEDPNTSERLMFIRQDHSGTAMRNLIASKTAELVTSMPAIEPVIPVPDYYKYGGQRNPWPNVNPDTIQTTRQLTWYEDVAPPSPARQRIEAEILRLYETEDRAQRMAQTAELAQLEQAALDYQHHLEQLVNMETTEHEQTEQLYTAISTIDGREADSRFTRLVTGNWLASPSPSGTDNRD